MAGVSPHPVGLRTHPWFPALDVITDPFVILWGTAADILSNQHLLPVTTEVCRPTASLAVAHTVSWRVDWMRMGEPRCWSRREKEEASAGDGDAASLMPGCWFV